MSKHPITLVIALAIATSVALSGCDSTSSLTEQEHIQRAKDFEDKGNLKGSIIELKNAIQKNPNSPQVRLLLGQIYLKVGMGAEAEKELTQAEKLGVSLETIKPHLGEALLLMGEYKRLLDEIQPSDQTSKINLARIYQLRADSLLKQGKVKDACNLFQQSLNTDKSNPATYWGLARCAVAERDMQKAQEWLDIALNLNAKQAQTWILIGDLKQLNGNTDTSLDAYSNALKTDPDNLDALQNRVIINTRFGRMEPARIDIERIEKLYPKSLIANYLQALFRFKEGKFPEARTALQEALKIDPNHLPSLLLGGSIENQLGNLQTAETHLNKAVRVAPRNGFALQMLAETQLRLGRPDDAEKTLAPIDFVKTKNAGIHALAGEIAMVKKDFTKAAEHLEKAAQLSPDSAAILTELGVVRLAQGDQRAMADLQAAAAMRGSDSRADTLIIHNQIRLKQFDAALASIASLEKKQGASPLIWNYRGAAYLGKKDTAKARESFGQALKLDPKFFPAAANLTQLDLTDKQPAAARKHFEAILKADPKHLDAMLALADLSLREKNEKAYIGWLEKAAQAHPQALQPRVALARHLLAKGDKNKALIIAREAVNAQPNHPAALNALGSVQLALGDTTNAISTFTTLTQKSNQSPDAHLQLAKAQIANKQFANARSSLKRALQIRPDHLPSQEALLRLELQENKKDAAVQIAQQMQTQHPNSPLGFDREGDILFSQKRLAQSIKAYEQALAKGAGSTTVVKLHRANHAAGNTKESQQILNDWLKKHPNDLIVHSYAAEFNASQGRNDEAITHYQFILRQTPNHVITLNNLASLYLIEKDKRALVTAEQALKLAPGNPGVQDTLGWILVEQGKPQKGLELLSKAVAKMPKAAAVRYHHAVALARTGEKTQAKKELEKLLAESPKFPKAEAAKALLGSL
ncbi:XrtA/PEP-CTERM system TPR-repeat protein PrsT [Thiobacillus sp.]